jgi:phage shock protein PspC (stress-responsive transcriptional regulator)
VGGQYDQVSSIWTVRRSATDAKLTGLCGGIAQHWGVDPLLVRVGCALLALSGGIGLVLYLAGWLLIPVEGKTVAPIDDLFGAQARKWPRELWVVIVVIASITTFATFGALTPFGAGPAIILALIWYFGFYKHRRPPRTRGSAAPDQPPAAVPPAQPPRFFRYTGPPTAFTQAAEAWQARIEEHFGQFVPRAGSGEAATSSPAGATWTAPPARNVSQDAAPTADEQERRDRNAFLAEPDPVGLYVEPTETTSAVLTRAGSRSAKRLRAVSLITLGLTLAGLGVAAYLGAAVPLAAYFGTALLVLGLSLVAATWLGRAGGLLSLAVIALIGVLATSALHTATGPAEFGSTRSYTRIVDLPAGGDSQDLGRLSVDLSKLNLLSDATYKAHVDLGTVTVVVPPQARVRIDYTVDTGAVRIQGRTIASGTELHQTIEPDPSTAGQPTLDLQLSVDSGTITVHR